MALLGRGDVRVSFRTKHVHLDRAAIAGLVLLAFAFLIGGASRGYALRLALVELFALPALVIGLAALLNAELFQRHRFALVLAGGTALAPLIQLLPLPISIWAAIPGREPGALALEITGLQPAWLPISLTPDLTWFAFLALIPPMAAFALVLTRGFRLGNLLTRGLLAFALLSVLLAAAQFVVGTGALFLWPGNEVGEVPGLFSNPNHAATLCLVAIPFAAVLGATSLRERGASAWALWSGAVLLLAMVLGLGLIGSRAGLTLLGISFPFALLAGYVASGRPLPGPRMLAVGGTVGLLILGFGGWLALPAIETWQTVDRPELRLENWPVVLEAADDFLPLGSGVGSFDSVFRSYEPLDQLDATYFNNAHNDYLEIWLEAGWVGGGLLIAFLVWYFRRSWRAWRAGPGRGPDLQRAASVAVLVYLLHSGFDYPLRTETHMVIFALCVALLELAPAPERERRRRSAG